MQSNYKDDYQGWYLRFSEEWNKARAKLFGSKRWKEQKEYEQIRGEQPAMSKDEMVAVMTKRLFN